ncbi:MAG: helix-turn-helix transcriptional regulator [Treponema sp.]|nr:helix-turn-helix transcriptional regulator [Treponema sp.]
MNCKYEDVKGYFDVIQCINISVDFTLTYTLMEDESQNLRKILAVNIKKQREKLGITQENLAEKAAISAAMMNDIEGCRTWISDKTLKKLSSALCIDTYRLFIPEITSGEAIPVEAVMELSLELHEMLKKYTTSVEETLKKRGFLFDKSNFSVIFPKTEE